MDLTRRSDDTFGDHITLHDATENINQNRLHLRVVQHDLEGFGNLRRGRTAANVQKVCRTATIKLGDIHGRHRQPRTIDEAADVAIERNVVEVEF